jgi:fucose permease
VRILHDPLRRRSPIWGTLAVVFLLVSVYRLSTAVLAERLAAAFDASATALGSLHAASFVVYAALQLPAGCSRSPVSRGCTCGPVAVASR